MPELDHIAVAAFRAAHADHHAVGGGPHRRPVRRREVHALVGAPHVQQRMEADAEPARHAAELQRRAQEGPPQRAAALVVEARYARRAVLEVERVARGAGDVDPRREDAAEPPLAFRRLQPLAQHREPVPRPDVPREVHFPIVHVRHRPGERAPLDGRQERVGHRVVERVVQRRLDRARHAQARDRPRHRLQLLDPPRAAANHVQPPLGREAHHHAVHDGVGLEAAKVKHEPGPQAPHREALCRGEERRIVSPHDAPALERVGERLPSAERIEELGVGGGDDDGRGGQRTPPTPCVVRGPDQPTGGEQPGGDRGGPSEKGRQGRQGRQGGDHQSICLRMNVGISSSLTSVGGTGGEGGGAAAERRSGCSAGFT